MQIIKITPKNYSIHKNDMLTIENSAFQIPNYTDEEVFDDLGQADNKLFLLVYHDNKPIAYVMCSTEDYAGVDKESPNNLYIFSFAVVPEYQKHGIGKWLFSYLLSLARYYKYPRVSYHTYNPAFKNLGKKLGFKTIMFERLDDDEELSEFMVMNLD